MLSIQIRLRPSLRHEPHFRIAGFVFWGKLKKKDDYNKSKNFNETSYIQSIPFIVKLKLNKIIAFLYKMTTRTKMFKLTHTKRTNLQHIFAIYMYYNSNGCKMTIYR